MERTCARAVELGLPAVAFTEHSDATPWDTDSGELDGYDHLVKHLRPDGAVAPPPFDVEGYLADSRRALEVNTSGPLLPEIVCWWRDEGGEGGETVTFGSDAHRPDALAHRFAEAAALVEAHSFRPGRNPYDHWRR